MNKKYRYLYAIVVFGLLCQGCAKKDDPNDVEETESTAQTAQTVDSNNPGKVIAGVQPGTSVGEVKLGMTVDELKNALGKPDTDATGISYVYTDLGIEVVIMDGKVHSVYCAHHLTPNVPEFKACKYRTEEGIGIGSSESDIMSAYGEPTKRGNGALMYKELGIRFELDNDQVQKIIVLKPW